MSAPSRNTLKPRPCSGSGSDRDDGWSPPTILAELISLFISPLYVPRAVQFRYIDTIKAAFYVETVHVDPELDAAGWTLLKSRPDKEWSLVDAASFTLMQERGISEALTTDHHFEQAGFVRLLKP